MSNRVEINDNRPVRIVCVTCGREFKIETPEWPILIEFCPLCSGGIKLLTFSTKRKEGK